MSNRKKVIEFLTSVAGSPPPEPTPHSEAVYVFVEAKREETSKAEALSPVTSTKTISGGWGTARRTITVPYITFVPSFTYAANVAPSLRADRATITFGVPGPASNVTIWGSTYFIERFNEGGNVNLVDIHPKLKATATAGGSTATGSWLTTAEGYAFAVPNYIAVFSSHQSAEVYGRESYYSYYVMALDARQLAESAWGRVREGGVTADGLENAVRQVMNKTWEEVLRAFEAAGMGASPAGSKAGLTEEALNRLRRLGMNTEALLDICRAYFEIQVAQNLAGTTAEQVTVLGEGIEAYRNKLADFERAVSRLSYSARTAIENAAKATIDFAKGLARVSAEMALSLLGTGTYTVGDIATAQQQGRTALRVTFPVKKNNLATISTTPTGLKTITVERGIWENEAGTAGWIEAVYKTKDEKFAKVSLPFTEAAFNALAAQATSFADNALNTVTATQFQTRDQLRLSLAKELEKALGSEANQIALPAWGASEGLNKFTQEVANAIEASPLSAQSKDKAKKALAEWANHVASFFTAFGINNVMALNQAIASALSELSSNPAYAALMILYPNFQAAVSSISERLKSALGYPQAFPSLGPGLPDLFETPEGTPRPI